MSHSFRFILAVLLLTASCAPQPLATLPAPPVLAGDHPGTGGGTG